MLKVARQKGRLTFDEIVELYKTKSVNAIAAMDGTSYVNILRILKARNVVMRSRGNNEVRVAPISHGHCQAAKRLKMTPYRYVRLMVIIKLGGKCNHCPETDLRVLDINHIHGEKAPQQRTDGNVTSLKYEEHCAILDGKSMPHIEVTCCNCNRRHEFERGNIPPIPEEFYAHASTNRSIPDRPYRG